MKGIGVDLCDVDRMRVVLDRTPTLRDRVFTADEQAYCERRADPAERYAARWAAKEAVLKAMGAGVGACRWRDIEVVRADSGAPSVLLHATAGALAGEHGIDRWLLTMTHTHLVAEAIAGRALIPVVTPAEMAAIDAAASEPVAVLIGRAGAAVASAALGMLGGGYGRRVVVLAGKGNNGADGREAAERLRRRGVRVIVVEAAAAPRVLPEADLVIDAAYGTGFRGEHAAPGVGEAAVLAVDIPSGVDGLTGEVRGTALLADRTVTFVAPKPGLLFEPGRRLAGEVLVADIGLPAASEAGVVEGADVAGWLPPAAPDAHKWRAAVLVVAGSPGMTGAAHLAAAAAGRAGAGMVRVGSPGMADDPDRPTEAVGFALPASGWAEPVRAGLDRFHALAIGPGLGTADDTGAAIREVVAAAPVPVVVDSDALTALGTDAPTILAGRLAGTVLTPHDGEYHRLVGAPPGADRIAAGRALAATTGAVVLLKGATTVVADPAGSVRLVMSGDARLATAGTGDILTGVIAALLARGLSPFDAAAAGAWLHGRAGTLGPPQGFVAGDLLALLPAALTELGSG